MWLLHQFPLCPFSRKVRLLLAEKGVDYELIREHPWERRDEFVDLNVAAQTPVLVESDRGVTLIDSDAICEFFEETVERAPMIAGTPVARAEIRRLVAWFDQQFHGEVVAPRLSTVTPRGVTSIPRASRRWRRGSRQSPRLPIRLARSSTRARPRTALN